ncbi:hypothetical protein KUCAC02_019910 [Chaenocephalus aceratus]|uniref:Uncharacterized protein n=1 Tax=Chaenocephalus aceratus TaxID=36190 RepID=A0ACB9VRL0_CHAAC|nr:hypothetical protein KUCAC02_019910 [Chaenocephalus aceratus]
MKMIVKVQYRNQKKYIKIPEACFDIFITEGNILSVEDETGTEVDDYAFPDLLSGICFVIKDELNDSGEHFYDGQKGGGFLAWRLKSVQRATRLPVRSKDSRIEENGGPMLRREIGHLFPRLLDTKGLILQDFSLLFGSETPSKLLEKWPTSFKAKVIQQAEMLTSTPLLKRLLLSAKNQRADEPSLESPVGECQGTPAGRKKTQKISVAQAIDHLVVFHKSCRSLDEHLQSHMDTSQPYLLASGTSKEASQKGPGTDRSGAAAPKQQDTRTFSNDVSSAGKVAHANQTGSLCGQGVSDESRVLNTQRSQRATLTQQTERLCAAEDARHAAVLERVRPREAAFSRSPDLSRRKRISLLDVPRLNWEYINKNQGRPESLDEEDHLWDKVLLAKTCAADRDRKPNWSSSFHRLSPVHPHIPSELRAIPLIDTPPPPPPPLAAAPPPRRRASRLPVFPARGAAERVLVNGCLLHSAKSQVETFLKTIDRLKLGSAPSPTPAAPKKTPAGPRKKGSTAAANMLPPLVRTPPTARLKGELNLGRCKTPSVQMNSSIYT